MSVRCRFAPGLAAALALAAAAPVAAAPMVTFTVTELGGGIYQYDLTVDNDGGAEPLSGLDLVGANTLFGLDDESVILAPAGWSFFAPLPPIIDELDWFSLSGASDIAVGAELGGFAFQTTTHPDAIGDTFPVEGIGGTSSTQIDLGYAVLVPEPGTAVLAVAGLLALAGRRRAARG